MCELDKISALDQDLHLVTNYKINPEDIKISTWSSSPKSNWINNMEKGIQITHLPSGIVVTCESHRNQHKNRAEAFCILEQKLINNNKRNEIHLLLLKCDRLEASIRAKDALNQDTKPDEVALELLEERYRRMSS